MKKGVKYLAVLAVLALGVVALYYGGTSFTGYAVFEQSNQSDFNGAYENVLYNSTLGAIVLNSSSNSTSGTYTSDVFNAGNESSWNNLTFLGNDLSFEVKSCATDSCVENFSNVTSADGTIDFSSLNLTGQYFQYKTIFNSNESNLTSVSLDYSVLFAVKILSPLEGEEYGSEEVELSVSANEEADSQWYVLNKGNKTFFSDTLNLNLTEGTDYNLTVYANNTGGEEVNSSVSFSVSSIITVWTFENNECTQEDIFEVNKDSNDYDSEDACEDEISSTEDDGEGSGTDNSGGSEQTDSETQPSPFKAEFSSGNFSELSLTPGSSESISWVVSNVGDGPSSGCTFSSKGNYSSWVSSNSQEEININAGDEHEFVFLVNVPEEAEFGEKTLDVSVQCSQTEVSDYSESFIVNVEDPNPEVEETETSPQRGFFTGLAIFGEDGIGTGGYVVLVIAVLALASIIFVSRKMRKEGKSLKDIFEGFESHFKRDEKSESSE